MKLHSKRKLGTMHHAISHSKNVEQAAARFAEVTARILLKLISLELQNLPVLLAADDRIIENFGKMFAFAKTLFDHSARSGMEHVNGHDLVTLMMNVPIVVGEDS